MKTESLNIAVLTISDTRTEENDKSGKILKENITRDGHQCTQYHIVPDNIKAIRQCVELWTKNKSLNAIITTGGTGLTARDVTPEAVEPLFDKHIPGFATIFHTLSYQKIKTSTIQSRTTAGIINRTFIFCLPGSPNACRDAWEKILKFQFDATHKPCNLIEIMNRM